MYANQDFQEQINDPSEFLVGRFRKVGKLGHFLTPTSACWLPSNANFAVSYRENLVSLFDTVTGKEICEIAFLSIEDKKIGGRHSKQDIYTLSQINKIETNSVHNLMVAGTEDCKIRFFDLKSNQLIKTVVGHADAISCLTPMMATNPHILVSGGHDGSVRIWDIRTFQLLHDMSANRRKYDEGTLAVAVNSQLSLLAAAGADSNVKLFQMGF